MVNYDIPNVCEDYVHRIGRTGRAGADGTAVNLVSLDEEGFMQAIERYTKQDIPVQIFEAFMPESGEKAEPIAMGRQTIWGGAGKPPSREVMQAAAKAARAEMLIRVRENKGTANARNPNPGRSADGPRSPAKPNRNGQRHRSDDSAFDHDQHMQPRSHLSAAEQAVRSSGQRQARSYGAGIDTGYGGATAKSQRGGQPDPMRTSVDMMSDRGQRRGGAFNGSNRNPGAARTGQGGARPTGANARPGNRPRHTSGSRGNAGR